MKSFISQSLMFAGAALLVGVTAQAVPVPALDVAKPGINVQVPPASGYFAYPTDWGKWFGGGGIMQSGDGRIVNDDPTGRAQYQPTAYGADPGTGTVVPMSTAEDWVLSFEWESNMQAINGTVFELSPASGDIARLYANGAGQYRLEGGNGTGSYVEIEQYAPGTVLLPNVVNTITLHYQASNGLLDFYINGNLEANDFAGRNGTYGASFVQLGGGPRDIGPLSSTAVDYFDNIKLGPIPEPAAISLLVLSVLPMVRRRK